MSAIVGFVSGPVHQRIDYQKMKKKIEKQYYYYNAFYSA